jgi:hypothetical protein
MTRRIKTRTPARQPEPKPEPIVVPPAPDEPAWAPLPDIEFRSMWDEFSTIKYTVRMLSAAWQMRLVGDEERSVFVLPEFQREWKWGAERCCSYMNSILHGEAQTPLVMWHQREKNRTLLLDGQHRLACLDALVVDHQGRERKCPPISFDLTQGRWVPGKADGITTFNTHHLHVMQQSWGRRGQESALRWGSDAFFDALFAVFDRMAQAYLQVTATMQPESPAAWLNVLAYFKRVNESVPFTDEELVLLDEYVLHNQQTTTSTMEPR